MNIIDQTIVRRSVEFKGQKIIYTEDNKTASLVLEDSELTQHIIAEVDATDKEALHDLVSTIDKLLGADKCTRKSQ